MSAVPLSRAWGCACTLHVQLIEPSNNPMGWGLSCPFNRRENWSLSSHTALGEPQPKSNLKTCLSTKSSLDQDPGSTATLCHQGPVVFAPWIHKGSQGNSFLVEFFLNYLSTVFAGERVFPMHQKMSESHTIWSEVGAVMWKKLLPEDRPFRVPSVRAIICPE